MLPKDRGLIIFFYSPCWSRPRYQIYFLKILLNVCIKALYLIKSLCKTKSVLHCLKIYTFTGCNKYIFIKER